MIWTIIWGMPDQRKGSFKDIASETVKLLDLRTRRVNLYKFIQKASCYDRAQHCWTGRNNQLGLGY